MGYKFEKTAGILAIFFLLPLDAEAGSWNESSLTERKRIFTELNQVASTADSELPPCEGHNRVSDAALKHEPPSDCPKARAVQEHVTKLDRTIRQNCKEMSRWLEDALRDPYFCRAEAPEKHSEAKEKFLQFKKEMQKDFDLPEGIEEEGIFEDKGEFTRPECAIPATVHMQFRKKQLALANKHYGIAGGALTDACKQPEAAQDYFQYLREGMPAFAEEQN